MYCDFFGFTQPPFNNTPDPRFFYATPQHEEALASLRYTAEQRKGFVLIAGEVGSGKTLLGRLVLQQLGSRARSASISSSALSPQELMATLCQELDVSVPPEANKTQMTQALQDYLLDKYAKDRLVVVVLDEAQNLPAESFEELRMLGNLEADDAKLLQVLILGQPEILSALRRPDMRQLSQRIFRSVHLGELSPTDTAGYIAHRLAVADNEGAGRFTPEAVELIHDRSGGVPRLINHICDQSLLIAYAKSVTTVNRVVVVEALEGTMSLRTGLDEPRRQPHTATQSHLGVGQASASGAYPRAGFAAESAILQNPMHKEDVAVALSRLDSETRQIVEDAQRCGTEVGQAVSEELALRIAQLRAGLSEQMADKTRRAADVLTEVRRQADEIAEQAAGRVLELQRSLSEELEGGLSKFETSLNALTGQAEGLIERSSRKASELGELCDVLGELTAKVAEQKAAAVEHCETLVQENTEAEKHVAKIEEGRQAMVALAHAQKGADRSASRLDEQTRQAEAIMRDIPSCVDQLQTAGSQVPLAVKNIKRLKRQNAEAEKHVTMIEEGRQALSRLAQAQSNADRQANALAQQADRTEDLIREAPLLVDQLHAATTEARMAVTELDRKVRAMTRSLDARVKTISQMLTGRSRGAVDEAIGSTERPPTPSKSAVQSGKTEQNAEPKVAVVGEDASDPEQAPLRVDAPAVQDGGPAEPRVLRPAILRRETKTDEDVEPLIEFDPRRGAAAHRAVTGRSRVIRGTASEGPLTAKHA